MHIIHQIFLEDLVWVWCALGRAHGTGQDAVCLELRKEWGSLSLFCLTIKIFGGPQVQTSSEYSSATQTWLKEPRKGKRGSQRSHLWPWLVWLSGLSASLWTERLLVAFPVRAHAWVAGWVCSWGCARGNQLIYLSHINVSLPLLFSPFPSL